MIDLGRKLGPLPVWAWGAGGLGAAFLIHRHAAIFGAEASVAAGPSDLGPSGGPAVISQGRDNTDRTDQGDQSDQSDQGGGGGDLLGESFYRGILGSPMLVGLQQSGPAGGGFEGSGGGGSTTYSGGFTSTLQSPTRTRDGGGGSPIASGGSAPGGHVVTTNF